MGKVSLNAQLREQKGKGAARKLRRDKRIPAIFYGSESNPMMLAVESRELERIVDQSYSDSFILDLRVTSDKGTETKKAMLKELQVDPAKGSYLHADFYEISMEREITLGIPIQLINTPVGVSNGGILQQIRRELTVSCLPDSIVDSLEVDVSELDIGDSLHIDDIPLPEGIQTMEEGHLTIAVVSAPAVEEEEEVEEALEEEMAEEAESGEETAESEES